MNKILELKAVVEQGSTITGYTEAGQTASEVPYNSPAPLDTDLMQKAAPNVLDFTKENNLITKATLLSNHVVENSILKNVYADPVRGHAIRNCLNDSSYRRPTIREYVENNKEKQWCFTWSEGCHSMITNPFKGKSLTGAAISFWARVPSFFSLKNHSSFLTFLGDLKYLEHPSHPATGVNDVLTTPFLEIACDGRIAFQEAYDNTYAKDMGYTDDQYSGDIPPYRHSLGRRWEHILVSITNETIDFYVNGVKLDYPTVYEGKRFNGGNGEEGNAGMSKLLDFISDNDTNLFLGLTILNADGQCDSILYDAIAFYDEAVDEAAALELFQEEVNLCSK